MRNNIIKVQFQIEKMRSFLITLASQKGSLIDTEVLAVSQQLDLLMNSYYLEMAKFWQTKTEKARAAKKRHEPG